MTPKALHIWHSYAQPSILPTRQHSLGTTAAAKGHMSNQHTTRLVLIILAVIGALAVIALLSMWLMHATMMGGNGMMDCRGIMGCGGWGDSSSLLSL
jgi:hypothetical protein